MNISLKDIQYQINDLFDEKELLIWYKDWNWKLIKFQFWINQLLWDNYNEDDINSLIWLIKRLIRNDIINWNQECLITNIINSARKQIWLDSDQIDENWKLIFKSNSWLKVYINTDEINTEEYNEIDEYNSEINILKDTIRIKIFNNDKEMNSLLKIISESIFDIDDWEFKTKYKIEIKDLNYFNNSWTLIWKEWKLLNEYYFENKERKIENIKKIINYIFTQDLIKDKLNNI